MPTGSGERAVRRGGVYGERPAAAESSSQRVWPASYTAPPSRVTASSDFVPHVTPLLHDGSGANKPWLLENPDPVTKLTWHSWVEVHPEHGRTARRPERRDPSAYLAQRLDRSAGLRLSRHSSRRRRVPLGFGHTAYGPFAKGRGVNALDLLGPRGGAVPRYVSTRSRSRRPAATRSSRPPRATRASWAGTSPRRCRSAGGQRPHAREAESGRRPSRGRGEHRARARGLKGWAMPCISATSGQLRGRASPVGNGHRPGQAAPAARPASPPATRRTTSRRSARTRSTAAGK